jgi:hypothetical protein
LKQFDD